MAFTYQSLKHLKSAAIDDGEVKTDDIGANQVGTSELADGAVTAGKLATAAVDVTSGTVTGTMPVSKGGTGSTSLSGSNNGIFSNGSSLTAKAYGMQGMQVYTGSSTWNKPSGVRYVKVQVQGGGGGGSGHGESGGAGGYAEEIINVTSVSSVSITVGGGGGGTYYSGAGGNANGSSFGNYCSAAGGRGANRNNQHSGGLGGSGSGGNLNVYGGGGGSHHQRSGTAGPSFWGGSVPVTVFPARLTALLANFALVIAPLAICSV